MFFNGDEVFDDEDEDDDWIFVVVVVGKLGGRRGIRGTLTRRDDDNLDCWVVEFGIFVVGRIRLCVERDFVIFLVDDEWVSCETVDGIRRVWDEEIANELFDDDDGRRTGADEGGIDDIELSRSFFIELDVWAAYDGNCDWEEDDDVVSPVLLRRERDDPRKRSSDRVRLTKIHTDKTNLLYYNEDLPRIFRVIDGFDDIIFGSVVVVSDRTYLLWRWIVGKIGEISSWVVLTDVDNVSVILKK